MNFGRQLKRVKQQADHLFLRTAEEQVEELRLLCEAYTRSLEKGLYTHSTSDEKKLRKVPEYQAAEALREVLNCLPPVENPEHQDLLSDGHGRGGCEDMLDKQVLGPLSNLIKDEFPSISKQKKQLKQVGLDLDAAKTRWRNSQATSGPNPKVDTYREELEEAESKLDQARREYMQKTLLKLDRVLPDMRHQLEASSSSPVYGVPLRDHLKIVQQEIAVPLQVCVRRLVEVGLFEEGLFRVAGSTSKVRRLKGAFDANLVTTEALAQADEHDRDYDVHVVAGALKCYLRVARASVDPSLWLVVNQLPSANLANLRYLVKFLAKLAANSSSNKMSPSNIAIEDIDFGVIPRVPPSPSRLHAEPNGSLPAPSQHGRPGPQTHRRNASSDLSGRIDNIIEPPKPPGTLTKPRPSPPTVEHLERSTTAQLSDHRTDAKVAPLGFEQMHTSKETDINSDDSEVLLRKKDTGEGPAPIGFLIDGKAAEREDGDSSRSFFKSLENVLQHQSAGQPIALPRHSSSLLMLLPSDYQANQSAAPFDLIQRPDKPALPEKPSLMNRSIVLTDQSKPQIPERPAVVAQRPSAATSSVPGHTQPVPSDTNVTDVDSEGRVGSALRSDGDSGGGSSGEDNGVPVLETAPRVLSRQAAGGHCPSGWW
ncbi:Rho GTPase-activating protein 17-like [Homarus americanus]|uniref:Rho GTPase-activating protein 17-like n=1 Tax=Homarus americanus TaxID=6706 RepID=A0A8J5TQB4_HOMAM|nr:Rho GTPase-activating protein 17-like [Homarus americanus]